MQKDKYYQQGDVILEAVAELPDGKAVPAQARGYVLAEGDATGNVHRIEEVAGVAFVEKDGLFYIQNQKPVAVKHEEHKTITLPAGIWRVRGVREYDHFSEEARRVVD